MKQLSPKVLLGLGTVVLLINSGYIAAFAHPTIFYMGNVLAHLVMGVVLAVLYVLVLAKDGEVRRFAGPAALGFVVALGLGLWLTYYGNVHEHAWALRAHIIAAAVGVVALLPYGFRQARRAGGARTFGLALQASAVFALAFPMAAHYYQQRYPNPNDRIVNPTTAPVTMDGEGGGPKSPFFPSSAKTNVGGIIPSNFFMDSKACGECHKDDLRAVEQLDAPLRLLQQPVLPQVDRVHAVGRRHAAQQVVRGLPRPRGVLQRPLRQADQGADRHAGSAGRPRVHLVPLDHARGQHHGQRRLHHRVPAPARVDEQQEPATSASSTRS